MCVCGGGRGQGCVKILRPGASLENSRGKNFTCQLVQEPKDKRKSSFSFNSRVWQPCGSKCPFMLQ